MLGLRAGRLSGGQRRLAQAAVALLGTPRLLLLDGPTAGADPETRAALLAAVRRRAAAGAAVLYTTHCLCELADLGATLTVAHQGRVIARGTPGSLLRGLPGELRLRFAAGADTRMLPAALAARARTIGGETRIASTDPAGDLGAVVAAGCAPVTVDVRRPGIDDLYRAIAAAAPRAA